MYTVYRPQVLFMMLDHSRDRIYYLFLIYLLLTNNIQYNMYIKHFSGKYLQISMIHGN